MPVNIVIADDHDIIREGIKSVLSQHPRYQVRAEAASGEEAIALAGSRKVHLALMDIELPGMNGLEATRRIKELRPEAAVIIVSQHAGDAYTEPARIAGAVAYITKDKVYQKLLPALDRAAASVVITEIPNE